MIFILDIDNTVTPPRQKIDLDFWNWFYDFASYNSVYFVTGSDYAKAEFQLSKSLCHVAKTVYCCSGNEVYKEGKLVRKNTWNFPQELIDYLNDCQINSQYPVKTGNFIEYRTGCVNYSTVGRESTYKQRIQYLEWDNINKERESIKNYIKNNFKDIDCVIGGEISVDIFPVGKDKSQILSDFNQSEKSQIIFFGDKIFEDGNDYTLAKNIENFGGKYHKVNDWEDTYNILRQEYANTQ